MSKILSELIYKTVKLFCGKENVKISMVNTQYKYKTSYGCLLKME